MMSTDNKYDYIIIGAGCAGLSLAYRLLNKNYKVCILESNTNINEKNKIWSFWDTKKTPFNHLIKKKWESLIIKNIRIIFYFRYITCCNSFDDFKFFWIF